MLRQGNTDVNGPHQGRLFGKTRGKGWFIHFRDRGVCGRVCYLQPVRRADDWPETGEGGEPATWGDTGLPAFVPERICPDRSESTSDLRWQ